MSNGDELHLYLAGFPATEMKSPVYWTIWNTIKLRYPKASKRNLDVQTTPFFGFNNFVPEAASGRALVKEDGTDEGPIYDKRASEGFTTQTGQVARDDRRQCQKSIAALADPDGQVASDPAIMAEQDTLPKKARLARAKEENELLRQSLKEKEEACEQYEEKLQLALEEIEKLKRDLVVKEGMLNSRTVDPREQERTVQEITAEHNVRVVGLQGDIRMKDGQIELLNNLMDKYRKESDDARRAQEKAEQQLIYVQQQLLGRALLDDFTDTLRMIHTAAIKSPPTPIHKPSIPNLNNLTLTDDTNPSEARKKDETGRRHLLQQCTCTGCTAFFGDIHHTISSTFHLGNSFTVKEMRATLVQCWDRFCKVAHPMEKIPIKIDAFQDEWFRHVLWGVAQKQRWRVEGV
ncbi:hypothetical protein HDV00_003602 [Rhizophlyctis rosea]|nr:hypothetical protein HDV00_003602 [Rhizophlyctis rosea]